LNSERTILKLEKNVVNGATTEIPLMQSKTEGTRWTNAP